MNTTNYDHYRIFYYCAKYKSFTNAANKMYLAQPNITRTIHTLEDNLGCKLFVRSKKGVTLTPEGEKLYEHIAIAHDHIEAAEKELQRGLTLDYGTITIGAGESALNLYLLEKLHDFKERYPHIHFKITSTLSYSALDALEKGHVDLAIITGPVKKPKHMISTKVDSYKEILVSPSDYDIPDELSLSEICKYPLIMLSSDTVTYQVYHNLFLRYGLTMEVETEAATSSQILPFIKTNLGIGFVPEKMALPLLENEEIKEIKVKEEIPERDILVIQDSRKASSVAVREFLKFIQTKNEH